MAAFETKNQQAKNRKLFSIVMATYNCGRKVENTLRSIFSQNQDLFELIVVDGASTDETLDSIKKFENGNLTVISERDAGVYDAFNKAIDLATGKYVYFIGAGDCLKPNVLERVKEFLPTDEPTFAYGYCYFVKQKIYNGREFTARFFARDNLCQQGIFYHRDLFEIVGKFDLRFKVLADWFFNVKCFVEPRINKRYIPCLIADYEEGGLSAEVDNDPVFKREFPPFVRKQFGVFESIVCRAFLKNPRVFNYIYYGHYNLLFDYWFANYALPNRLVSFGRPYVRGYRRLKKIAIDRN